MTEPAWITAREHIAYCRGRGMTPVDVCESVGAFLDAPTWATAEAIIRQRDMQIRQGRPVAILTDRSAG